jgi:aspartyl-tRNA(Asn)/glutamyl-tRNA(Gln) amidotransferase subunit C
MSQVTKAEITKISRLARIEVSDSEKEALTTQVGKIIGWVDQLSEVNTDNVEILTNVHDMKLSMHEDKIADGGIAEDVLKNAENAKYGYFAVPKVIE